MEGLSETAAKAISNIKFDKVIVWENGGKDGAGSTAGFLQNMARTLPPMLQIMQDIGGVKMPEYFGKMVEPPTENAAAQNGHGEAAGVAAPISGGDAGKPGKRV
jgi:flotillin